MNLDEEHCWAALTGARHGVLATVHPIRGVDAVPVVFAVVRAGGADRAVAMPVDAVKAKRSPRLRRLVNLETDSRCVLLVDRYDDDWSHLWWVRVHGRASAGPPTDDLVAALAQRYPQYRPPGSIVRVVTLVPTAVMGWRAG